MQRIIVRNFGPIQEAEIEIDKLMIFVGEPATGKSTLAKLVYFFKSLSKDVKDFIQYDSRDITLLRATVQDKFALYFGSSRFLPLGYYVKFYFSNTKYLELTGSPLRVTFEGTFFDEIVKTLRPLARTIRGNGTRNAQPILDQLDSKLAILFEDGRRPSYIPAWRAFTVFPASVRLQLIKEIGNLQSDKRQLNAKIDLFLMSDFMNEVEKTIEIFRENGGSFKSVAERYLDDLSVDYFVDTSARVLRGEYKVVGTSELISIPNAEQTVLLSQASSGQQEIIRLLQDVFLSVVSNDSQFKIVEEPEAHMSPHSQHLIISLLFKWIENTESQVLMTTHSDHIINGLLVLIKEATASGTSSLRNENIRIYFFSSRKDSNASNVIPISITDFGKINDPPVGFFDQYEKDLKTLIGF